MHRHARNMRSEARLEIAHPIFFRCATLTGWRLAAQGTFLAGRRARKSGGKSVLAQNRRSSSRWTRKSRRGVPTLQATQAHDWHVRARRRGGQRAAAPRLPVAPRRAVRRSRPPAPLLNPLRRAQPPAPRRAQPLWVLAAATLTRARGSSRQERRGLPGQAAHLAALERARAAHRRPARARDSRDPRHVRAAPRRRRRRRRRRRHHRPPKEEGPRASRHANDCLALECECLTLLLGVLERICEGVWVSRFEGFWLWVSWKFILKIVCFDCRNSPFSLRGALPRTPLGASPQTPELAGP